MRQFTIFNIWQADRNTARNWISKTLDQVAKSLSDNEIIVGIDQNADSETGSPTIDHVILERIARADIVVADLSIVGRSENGTRALPNPNVLFETGYAFATVGPERVILLKDEKNGLDGELPFDLRQRRTIIYNDRPDLRSKLEESVAAVLVSGPALPGSVEERANIVRLLVGMTPAKRGTIAIELDLVASSADGTWSSLARYFRRNTGKPRGWKVGWHYDVPGEAELLRDIRLALIPATAADQRESAVRRIHRYLTGCEVLLDRTAFQREVDSIDSLPKLNRNPGHFTNDPPWLTGLTQKLDEFKARGVVPDDLRAALANYQSDPKASNHQTVAKNIVDIQDLLSALDPCLQQPA